MSLREQARAETADPAGAYFAGERAKQAAPSEPQELDRLRESVDAAQDRHGVPESAVYHPETGRMGEAGGGQEPDEGVIHTTTPWEALPQPDYTNSGIPATPRNATVYQAWQAVMAEVQQLRKGDRFSGGGQSYEYRGVDAVVNAVGPALRKHGVAVFPVDVDYSYRDTKTAGGKPTREVVAKIRYEIRGPQGDMQVAASQGESLDSGDKGTTKANTVAFRNLLLTALSVPIQAPAYDPDRTEYRRGEPVELESATQIRDRALDPQTTVAELQAMFKMVHRSKGTRPELGSVMLSNEVGDDEALDKLVYRIKEERTGGTK